MGLGQMPDLNFDINYFDHIKVKRLVARLGPGSDVLPLRVWCYAAKHYPKNGKLVGHTAQDIESAAGWAGESGLMAQTFVDVRLLDLKKNLYSIHNWKARAGHLISYSIRAKRAAKARWSKLNGDATSMLEPCLANAPTQPTKPTNETNPIAGISPPTIRQVLKWAKVGGGVGKCERIKGLTPVGVMVMALGVKEAMGGPGVLVTDLTSPGFQPMRKIEISTLASLIRDGRIFSINDYPVNGNFKYSNHELFIGEKVIPISEVSLDRIVVNIERPM